MHVQNEWKGGGVGVGWWSCREDKFPLWRKERSAQTSRGKGNQCTHLKSVYRKEAKDRMWEFIDWRAATS